ncbi:protein ninH [Cronobacter malonaticus]|uniref:protein ninH n=1 Tax=Cronobacter malonaticus TaxID=413503 RepID=UPI000CFCC388|nr:protein ninH [Cronobacter malonaticus]ELY4804024.1 protein ninH [Cronobacter malonaticus]MDI6405009.1 protein ninH [Cronobacter malonaticus]MDT3600020.1 protein ninH [Cronobacter malonaticus]MDT3642950.1 protein ninH [Cronobacter malonaticus]
MIIVQTVPRLLQECKGNITELSRKLSCHRDTVRKYIGDIHAKRHAVINGVLMTSARSHEEASS